MIRRLLQLVIVPFIVALVLGSVAIGWYLRERTSVVYTDAAAIEQPAETAKLRDVLWQPAAPLPPIINTAEDDYEPRMSADGGTLFFVRGRAGEDADLYFSRRTYDGWSAPEPISAINTEADELGPAPTADGTALYFYSNRAGGLGAYDLWISQRVDDQWQTPVNLGSALNSPYNDYGPAVTPGHDRLYFASNRPRPGDAEQPDPDAWTATLREDLYQHDYDIYEAPISERGLGLARPVEAVNTPHHDGAPAVSPAGDFLYFASDRPDGHGGFDLYRVRRLVDDHRMLENLGGAINSSAHELDPGLSLLGFELHFSSNRPLEPGAEHDPSDYNLFYSTSREVFADARTHRAVIDWAGLWAAIWPNLLWALLALLLLLFLLFLLHDARFRKASLLTRCLLGSALAHLLLLFLLTLWGVTASLSDAMREGSGIRITMSAPSTGAELAEQVLGEMTEVELVADTPESARRAFEAALPTPLLALAEIELPRADVPDVDPLERTVAEESEHVQPLEVETLDAPPEPVEVAAELNVPEEARRSDAREVTAALNPPAMTAAQRSRSVEPLPVPTVRPVELAPADSIESLDDTRPLAEWQQPDDSDTETMSAAPEPMIDAPETTEPVPVAVELPVAERVASSERQAALPTFETPSPRSDQQPTRIEPDAPVRVVETSAGPAAIADELSFSAVTADDSTLEPADPDLDTSIELAQLPERGELALPDDAAPAKDDSETDATSILPRSAVAMRPLARRRPNATALDSDAAIIEVPVVTERRLDETTIVDAIDAVESTPLPTPAESLEAPLNAELPPALESPIDDLALPTESLAAVAEPERAAAAASALPRPAQHESQRFASPPAVEDTTRSALMLAETAIAPNPITEPTRLLDRPAVADSPAPSFDDPLVEIDPAPLALMTPVDIELDLPTETTAPPNPYPQRAPEQRQALLEKLGGSDETEEAVNRALAWLARHQSPDGRWDSVGFDDGCRRCGGEASIVSDNALTGLALLCFLAADHTHFKEGEYREHVQRGLDFLLSQQTPNGDLRSGETMYSHGIAAIALSEAYGMTGDDRLREPVQRAMRFIWNARDTRVGGWRYDPGQVGDTSVLGWQVMALVSARRAGVDVEEGALEVAKAWLDRVSRGARPGLYAYQPGQPVTPPMTAEAMFCRQLLGHDRNEAMMQASADYVLRHLPDWATASNTYYWYYATLAMFQHQGEHWETWNSAMKRELLAHQRRTGRAAGSWDPEGQWAHIGGRVYQTAICTLTLEVYYRYLPLYAIEQPDR